MITELKDYYIRVLAMNTRVLTKEERISRAKVISSLMQTKEGFDFYWQVITGQEIT